MTFHRLAADELEDAARYYEQQSAGLGEAFLGEVERCLRMIEGNPEAGTPAGRSIRRRLVGRFPYGLLYSIARDDIRILAVMNLKRRPNCWVGRE